MIQIKKFLIPIFILLLNSFIYSQNYVANIESIKKNKDPQLVRITDGYELLSIGEEIQLNDTLQTGPYTKAEILFDNLTLDINPLSRIVVRYAFLVDKVFRANYELKEGNIYINLNSSKYEDTLLTIYIPYNKSSIIVNETVEFKVNSKGYVKTITNYVKLRRGSDLDNHHLKIRILGPEDFGSIDSEIINKDLFKKNIKTRNNSIPNREKKDPRNSKREPFNAPDKNKAPSFGEDRR